MPALRHAVLCCFLLLPFSPMQTAGVARGQTESTLRVGFSHPPAEAAPRVWYHWMDGDVDKAGIALDLDWMHRIGIGGFQTVDASLGLPLVVPERVVYMTPPWLDAFHLAMDKANALKLDVTIDSSPGWSEAGGPWVQPVDGMKKYVWSETVVEGGKPFRGTLEKPPTNTGAFQSLPVHDVLAELGRKLGSPLRIVGTKTAHPVACINYDRAEHRYAPVIPELWRERIQQVLHSPAYRRFRNHAPAGAILGTAAGASLDERGKPALIVYVSDRQSNLPVPATIDGVRTQVIPATRAAIARGNAPMLPIEPEGIHLSAASLAHAEQVANRHARAWLRDPAILGVGVAQSLDRPSEAALLVLINLKRIPLHMPAAVDGLRIRYIHLQRFHVTLERAGPSAPASCAAEEMKSALQRLP